MFYLIKEVDALTLNRTLYRTPHSGSHHGSGRQAVQRLRHPAEVKGEHQATLCSPTGILIKLISPLSLHAN